MKPDEDRKYIVDTRIRLTIEQRDLLRRAARLERRSVSNFTRQAALSYAEALLAKRRIPLGDEFLDGLVHHTRDVLETK